MRLRTVFIVLVTIGLTAVATLQVEKVWKQRTSEGREEGRKEELLKAVVGKYEVVPERGEPWKFTVTIGIETITLGWRSKSETQTIRNVELGKRTEWRADAPSKMRKPIFGTDYLLVETDGATLMLDSVGMTVKAGFPYSGKME